VRIDSLEGAAKRRTRAMNNACKARLTQRRRTARRSKIVDVSIVMRTESGTEAAEPHESRVRDRVTLQAPPVLWMSTGAAGL